MSDVIRITGLRVRGRHGVYEEERRKGQDFVVDASLELWPVDTRAAAASDALVDTIDYGGLADRLATVVSGPPVALLETLAHRLTEVCLADPRVRAAEVTVHKPEAPIDLVFEDVSVTIRRERYTAPDARGVAILSIGSNVGDREARLRAAVAGLADVLLAVSPVYETAPWGGVEQAAFLNAVVVVGDSAEVTPREWLWRAHALEAAAGRQRRQHWGPRTLDVDIVTFTRAGEPVRSADPVLTLPHPHAHQRAFVLVPWLDVDPDGVLPGHGPVRDLVAGVDRSGLRRTDVDLRP